MVEKSWHAIQISLKLDDKAQYFTIKHNILWLHLLFFLAPADFNNGLKNINCLRNISYNSLSYFLTQNSPTAHSSLVIEIKFDSFRIENVETTTNLCCMWVSSVATSGKKNIHFELVFYRCWSLIFFSYLFSSY